MVLKCFMMQLDHLIEKHLIVNVYQDTLMKKMVFWDKIGIKTMFLMNRADYLVEILKN